MEPNSLFAPAGRGLKRPRDPEAADVTAGVQASVGQPGPRPRLTPSPEANDAPKKLADRLLMPPPAPREPTPRKQTPHRQAPAACAAGPSQDTKSAPPLARVLAEVDRLETTLGKATRLASSNVADMTSDRKRLQAQLNGSELQAPTRSRRTHAEQSVSRRALEAWQACKPEERSECLIALANSARQLKAQGRARQATQSERQLAWLARHKGSELGQEDLLDLLNWVLEPQPWAHRADGPGRQVTGLLQARVPDAIKGAEDEDVVEMALVFYRRAPEDRADALAIAIDHALRATLRPRLQVREAELHGSTGPLPASPIAMAERLDELLTTPD